MSIDPPKQRPWFGTFGAMLLCTRTGEPITIKSVTPTFTTDPVPFEVLIRVVNQEADGTVTPVASHQGKMADLPGVLEPTEGFVVTRHCDDPDPGGFDELMLQLQAGNEVAAVTPTVIKYTVDDEDYELREPWEFIVGRPD